MPSAVTRLRDWRHPDEPHEHSKWDTQWRAQLADNLETLAKQLWQVGVREIYADGAFAEDKDHPNDIDGYLVCTFDQLRTGEMVRRLNLLDPYKVWTWDPASRKAYRGYPKKQLPMWHRYRVELYPSGVHTMLRSNLC